MSCWHIKCENEFQWGKSAIKNRFYSDTSEGNRCSTRINVKKGKRSRNCCSAQYHFLSHKSNDLKQHLAVCDTCSLLNQPAKADSLQLKHNHVHNPWKKPRRKMILTMLSSIFSLRTDCICTGASTEISFLDHVGINKGKLSQNIIFALYAFWVITKGNIFFFSLFFLIFISKKHKFLRPLVFH